MQVLFNFPLLETERARNKRQYDGTDINSVFRNFVVESHSVNMSVAVTVLLI